MTPPLICVCLMNKIIFYWCLIKHISPFALLPSGSPFFVTPSASLPSGPPSHRNCAPLAATRIDIQSILLRVLLRPLKQGDSLGNQTPPLF